MSSAFLSQSVPPQTTGLKYKHNEINGRWVNVIAFLLCSYF